MGQADLLLQGLKNKEVQKSTKNLAEASKHIEEAGTEPFELLKDISFNLGGPLQGIINTINAEIKSGTADAQARLYTELRELIESPAGQTTMNALVTMLNFGITHVAAIVDFIDKLINSLLELMWFGQRLPGGGGS